MKIHIQERKVKKQAQINEPVSDCRQRTPRNYVSRSFFLAIAKVFCLTSIFPPDL